MMECHERILRPPLSQPRYRPGLFADMREAGLAKAPVNRAAKMQYQRNERLM